MNNLEDLSYAIIIYWNLVRGFKFIQLNSKKVYVY